MEMYSDSKQFVVAQGWGGDEGQMEGVRATGYGISFGGQGKYSKINSDDVYATENMLRTTQLHTLNG